MSGTPERGGGKKKKKEKKKKKKKEREKHGCSNTSILNLKSNLVLSRENLLEWHMQNFLK